jgi:hypothetical protein
MASRYRCSACGNLTRFDVVATRRSREYHHFSVGGELNVEEGELLEERVEQVTCRWCAATGAAIEHIEIDAAPSTIDRPT